MAELNIDMAQGNPEFSEEELDSLKVGEEMQAQEREMLAGKFKDAEELEKAYIELQKKLGSPDEPQEKQEELRETEASEEVELSPGEQLITSASAEWYEKGELAPETIDKFKDMSSTELVEAYIKMQQNAPQEQVVETRDLTDAETNNIYNQVGGESSYQNLMQWASETLPESYTKTFDDIVETGNYQAIQMAVAGLQSQYESMNGYEGNLRTGKSVVEKADVFRSQAEVIEAMNDRRYDVDPAYRQDVFEKLKEEVKELKEENKELRHLKEESRVSQTSLIQGEESK